jgi:hypothetical protein
VDTNIERHRQENNPTGPFISISHYMQFPLSHVSEKKKPTHKYIVAQTPTGDLQIFNVLPLQIYRHCHDDLTSCPAIGFTDLHVCMLHFSSPSEADLYLDLQIENFIENQIGIWEIENGIVKCDDERVVENSVCICRDFRKYSSAHSLALCIWRYGFWTLTDHEFHPCVL